MKRVLTLLLAAMMTVSFAACEGYRTESFVKMLEEGDYEKAAEVFIKAAAGSIEKEQDAKQTMEAFIEEAVAAYWMDEMDVETVQTKLQTVRKIAERTEEPVEAMSDLLTEFDQAQASKAAFQAGNELMDAKNYRAAMEELKKVLEKDVNYAAAQELIKTAVDAYKEDALKQAEECAVQKDYGRADTILADALSVLPEDADLAAKRTVYTQENISAHDNQPDLSPEEEDSGLNIRGEHTDYDIPPAALQDEVFAGMISEAEKYLGYPYAWGGSNPSTSFDCSGFVSWVINHSGWNVGRLNAQGLLNICTRVSSSNARPGDLIFFQGTYDTIGASHCGIYVGNGMMIHCGDPISYANINTGYWQSHFLAFGRLP